MIFGRILKSLKSGNFSFAVLELVMIIVGVFIAFQVDQWNEDRKAGVEEVLWLEAVRNDLDDSPIFIQGRIAYENKIIKGLDEVLRALDSGEVPPRKKASFEDALQRRFIAPAPYQLVGTIQQLNADGLMNEIQDSVLRRLLIALIGYAAAYNKNIDGISESFRDATHHYANFYELDIDLKTGRTFVAFYDLEAMRADPQFKLDIIYIRSLHVDARGANETLLSRMQEVINILDENLGDAPLGDEE